MKQQVLVTSDGNDFWYGSVWIEDRLVVEATAGFNYMVGLAGEQAFETMARNGWQFDVLTDPATREKTKEVTRHQLRNKTTLEERLREYDRIET